MCIRDSYDAVLCKLGVRLPVRQNARLGEGREADGGDLVKFRMIGQNICHIAVLGDGSLDIRLVQVRRREPAGQADAVDAEEALRKMELDVYKRQIGNRARVSPPGVCETERHSVTKCRCMVVHAKWAQITRQAGWHRRMLSPVPAKPLGQEFFYFPSQEIGGTKNAAQHAL